MNLKIKPISHWTGTETKAPRRSQFRQTYSSTKKLLIKELSFLNTVGDAELSMFIHPADLRLDGELRANVKPLKPGVILTIVRIKRRAGSVNELQTLTYPCDAFDDWQDNLRAVALSLEALRKVERFGVFKFEDIVQRLALPDAREVSSVQAAANFIAAHSGYAAAEILGSVFTLLQAYRKAAAKLHPDTGGNHEQFLELQKAKEILERSFETSERN